MKNTLKAIKILASNFLDNSRHSDIKAAELNTTETKILREVTGKGYYVWKNFLSSEQCGELRSEIDRLIDRGEKLKVYDNSDFRIYAGNALSEKIDVFNKNKTLKNIAQGFLKMKASAFFTLSAKIIYKDKNLGSGQGWHRDTYWPFQFKAMVYLTNVTPQNGPFQILERTHTKVSLIRNAMRYKLAPNKHRFTEEEVNRIAKDEKIITFTGQEGDLIIFNSYCIHRGSPLQAGTRYALTNYYYPDYMINENQDKFQEKFNL